MKNHMKLAALALSVALAAPVVAIAQNADPGVVAEGETPIRITVGGSRDDRPIKLDDHGSAYGRAVAGEADVRKSLHRRHDFPTKVTLLDPELPTEGTELGGAPGIGDIAHNVPNGNFGFYYGQLEHWPGVVTLGFFDGDPDVFARQTGPFEVTIERAAD
jgi:hypothetical protein